MHERAHFELVATGGAQYARMMRIEDECVVLIYTSG